MSDVVLQIKDFTATIQEDDVETVVRLIEAIVEEYSGGDYEFNFDVLEA